MTYFQIVCRRVVHARVVHASEVRRFAGFRIQQEVSGCDHPVANTQTAANFGILAIDAPKCDSGGFKATLAQGKNHAILITQSNHRLFGDD